jgi:hypothetical protein
MFLMVLFMSCRAAFGLLLLINLIWSLDSLILFYTDPFLRLTLNSIPVEDFQHFQQCILVGSFDLLFLGLPELVRRVAWKDWHCNRVTFIELLEFFLQETVPCIRFASILCHIDMQLAFNPLFTPVVAN